jgi:hypothetical protein
LKKRAPGRARPPNRRTQTTAQQGVVFESKSILADQLRRAEQAARFLQPSATKVYW